MRLSRGRARRVIERRPSGAGPSGLDLLRSGCVELPPGKIAAVVTCLEMREPPPLPTAPPQARFVPLAGDVERYCRLFRAVGEDWLWFSRLVMPRERLGAILSDPRVEALALAGESRDLGLIELDFRRGGECELCFFGLVPEAIGRGFARVLMAEALRRAWARPIERLWLHTCSLDHPAALPFYLRCGFSAYKRVVEVAEDPRLSGHLPLAAAPQVPVLGR